MTEIVLNSQTESSPSLLSETGCREYIQLLKPRVMSLVVFTGFVGMSVAPGAADTHPVLLFTALLCLALGAGAAGAINMWYDRDIDAVMTRTRNRPIPLGRIPPQEALAFAVILSVFSVMMMGLSVNWVAAGILAFANIFYSVVYTMWLKRRTPQNIVIGGAAGAFPPMIGWAAVTGHISLDSLILFLIIFFWTPPHFWALSLFAGKDYQKAGIPMMNVIRGDQSTKRQMLGYTLLLLPVSFLPVITGLTTPLYGALALGLGGMFVIAAIRTLRSSDLSRARQMFAYSIFYLFAIFLGIFCCAA
ncbi:MAG: protoheme IX farnesyltransferase [Rhodospirillales bacterium]|nr:protoheme IX farnesyltransferase [Rhodospirillales bacterium]MCB9964767.1 protoheme IX farnesyltransferase [Rhodospirillales bacterium]MCB9973767.1 protoheme IX farnesyltransferase [Rhodospirillales bacterium]MCB9980653.1 protoheme IX farnesyltransferase [Rhodospirillales bacterium]